MPEVRTHDVLEDRSPPPVFGRRGVTYLEIDEISGTKALADGEVVGEVEQWQLMEGVTRVRFSVEGTSYRTLDDLIPLPAGDARPPDLTGVGSLKRYDSSRGGARNTALALGISRGGEPGLIFDSFQLEVDEELYGLGERQMALKVRGSRERLWICDPFVNTTGAAVYIQVPFVASTRGWGVAALHGGGVIVEAGNPTGDALTFAVEAGALDYLVFESEDLQGVLRLLAEVFGKPRMTPDWSLGVWMSRLMYFSRAEVEEMIDALTEDGFPVDVIHLDPYWHRAEFVDPAGADRSTLQWNEEAFGSAEDFFAEMDRRRVRVSLWESPYLATNNSAYSEAKEAGLLVDGPEGPVVPPGFDWDAGIVDFTNPEAVEWWKERHRPILSLGDSPAVIKADFGESVPSDAQLSDGRAGHEIHNAYAIQYHRTVAEVLREIRDEDWVIWARSGFFTSPATDVAWVGDSISSWFGMACALRSVLSLSMSGWSFVSVDIGGFIGWHEAMGPPPADLFVRWSQWGLLLSHARFHGVGGREPVLIDEPERSIVRDMCLRRMRWLPYLKKVCERSVATGEPVARPLAYSWGDHPAARADELAYTLGPSVLVAPVFRPDGFRAHWLPPGRWTDVFTGETFEGEGWRSEQFPLERFPLYVREGDDLGEAEPALRAEDVLGGGG